jgi:hypothetical protein
VADYVNADVEIAPLPGNAAAINSSLDGHMGSTVTPTPPALQGAVQHAQTWAQGHPGHVVIVVLVTDGQPNTCGSDGGNAIADVQAAAAAGLAGAPKIVTYVVGITAQGQTCIFDQNPPNEDDLNAVAMAGGSDRAFLVDTSVGDAVKQFFDAVSAIQAKTSLPCEYAIPQASGSGKVDPKKVNLTYASGAGQSNDVLLAMGGLSQCDPNTGGWYYDDPQTPTKIELCPSTCSQVSSDDNGKVHLVLGCEQKVITPH